jgi:hypothetical protein
MATRCLDVASISITCVNSNTGIAAGYKNPNIPRLKIKPKKDAKELIILQANQDFINLGLLYLKRTKAGVLIL